MCSSEIALTIMGILGTIFSILFSFIDYIRNDKKDTYDEGKKDGIILYEINRIKSSIEIIGKNIDNLEERCLKLSSKIVKDEENVTNAHKKN